MARHGGCRYCEAHDCNGRCSRSSLKIRIDRLLEMIEDLEKGEHAMESQMDSLAAEKNQLLAQLKQNKNVPAEAQDTWGYDG
jgi:hypothetical protein